MNAAACDHCSALTYPPAVTYFDPLSFVLLTLITPGLVSPMVGIKTGAIQEKQACVLSEWQFLHHALA